MRSTYSVLIFILFSLISPICWPTYYDALDLDTHMHNHINYLIEQIVISSKVMISFCYEPIFSLEKVKIQKGKSVIK